MNQPFSITDEAGTILARFSDEQERDDALMSGEYPDDAEPAYENEFPTFAEGDVLQHARFLPGFEPEGMAIGDTGLSLYCHEDEDGTLHVLIVK